MTVATKREVRGRMMGTMKRKRVRAENGKMGSLHAMPGKFPDERSCERRVIEVRWPGGWECPRCGNARCSPVADRNRVWQCTRCSHQFSVTAGTCMQHSKVHLRRWFHAIWLVARSKRGVSAMELAAQIGVSEATAGFMLERLRGSMARSECANVLEGAVELDDFFLDSRDRTRRREVGRGADGQPMICAARRTSRERGRCVVRVVPDCSGATYGAFAEEHVDRAAHVRTDCWRAIGAGLRGWEGLDQRKFDEADDDARLPTVHHVNTCISAWVSLG